MRLSLFLLALSLYGQSANRVIYVTSAPSGSCATGAAIQRVISTGHVYSCLAGTWADITGAGSATGVTSFNTRIGAVTLTSGDVTTALGYTPVKLNTANAGDIIFTDATYDIGKSGATRPRDLFLSRNLVVGGVLTTPTVTISGSSFLFNGLTCTVVATAISCT